MTDFQSLSVQVAGRLRAEIAEGRWAGRLPGERLLAERLQVSRKTIRRALAELRARGVLATRPGRGSVPSPRRKGRPPGGPFLRVALLLPDPLEQQRPFTALWVGGLMARLQEKEGRLQLLHGRQYYGAAAGRSLAALVRDNPAACWILARSNRAIQAWFRQAGIPVVVAGSAHEAIPLASVDIDQRALGRHAAGVFLRHGHRDLALALDAGDRAGDAETERGFREGLAGRGARLSVWRTPPAPAALVRELSRGLRLSRPPTGLFVSSALSYLTAASWLAARGKAIPGDISLVCREDEPFLSHLHPPPCRYACSPARFASLVKRAVQDAVRGFPSGLPRIRIMPEFAGGHSLGDAPR